MADTSVQAQQKIEKVLKHLKISNPILIGTGGEGYVYQYGKCVLKIYTHNLGVEYARNVQELQNVLAKHTFSFETPQIVEVGQVDNAVYTIEKQLSGVPMDQKIKSLGNEDRKNLYHEYYEAICHIHTIKFPDREYGQIIDTPESLTAGTWSEYLDIKLMQKVAKTRGGLTAHVKDYDAKVELFRSTVIPRLETDKKSLIHSDYYLNNVLVDNNNHISAILDFSVHTAVGDPRMDIAGVLTWNEISPDVHPEDYLFLYDTVRKDFGDDFEKWVNGYFLFSSFYFADMDDNSFSVRNLNNEKLWQI